MIDLVRAAPHVKLHRGATFVIKVGGGSLARGVLRDRFAQQVATIVTLGSRVVVVHGGGPQTDAVQRELGEAPRMIDGRRVTTEKALEALRIATGRLTSDVIECLRAAGLDAIGVPAATDDLVVASRRAPMSTSEGSVDFGLVGDIHTISPRALRLHLYGDRVPVLAPPASDGEGGHLNVNADLMAAELAKALGAAKLVLMTGAPGILRGERRGERRGEGCGEGVEEGNGNGGGSPISALALDELARLTEDGSIAGGMKVKAAAITAALEGGVPRVHVVSGSEPDALLRELYTTHGAGTLVTLAPEQAPAEGATA